MTHYPATDPDTETEEPGILVYNVEGPTGPTPQEEAERNCTVELTRQRARTLLRRAARERWRLRRVHHRRYYRRLMQSNPRDARET